MLTIENHLKAKRALPNPLDSKPQLEAQRAAATDRHFSVLSDLLALAHTQWEGVRERGVLELALREAEMQVRAIARGPCFRGAGFQGKAATALSIFPLELLQTPHPSSQPQTHPQVRALESATSERKDKEAKLREQVMRTLCYRMQSLACKHRAAPCCAAWRGPFRRNALLFSWLRCTWALHCKRPTQMPPAIAPQPRSARCSGW